MCLVRLRTDVLAAILAGILETGAWAAYKKIARLRISVLAAIFVGVLETEACAANEKGIDERCLATFVRLFLPTAL